MNCLLQRIRSCLFTINIKIGYWLWILIFINALILLFVNIIFIRRVNCCDDDLSKIEKINSPTLSLIVLVSDKRILEAAKDTWILDCPFEVIFNTSEKGRIQSNKISIDYLTTNRTLSHNHYKLTIDVRFYVIVARLQQLIMEDRFRIYCSTPYKKSDCLSLLNNILIGPLNTSHDFDRVHLRFTKSSRRPVQNPTNYNSSIDPKCVHNPVIQLETYPRFYLHECPSPPLPRTPIQLNKLPTYVITIKKTDSEQIKSIVETFRLHGLHVRLYQGFQGITDSKKNSSKLSIGERNLRETMRRFIIQMINTKVNRVLVFEDDVLPHKHFGSLLRKLITTENPGRCTAHLLDGPDAGGILLLGATVWSTSNAGWKMIDQDLKNSSLQSPCFNIDRVTFGAFAVLIHRMTFQPMLNWLNDPAYQHLPYDHMFSSLSRRGHIVRVAYPFLVIPDISHVSSVNPQRAPIHNNITWRSKIHRWSPLTDYSLMPNASNIR
ncbi:unnamed protein product [Adineta steineri]|uniref:Uncharacterized protein n=1 Tax=Adineta steineri TaxID=433720 RepID=A0A818NNJ7_9BILA|nr:unnamed protein product [Adineta steineri]CAF1258289.1 unnamed protein product [Adineta steineri]CAF3610136.1 unnamed protein product [Adineta steineri]CAF3725585.1 unnamed protein product [Adineta steineri]